MTSRSDMTWAQYSIRALFRALGSIAAMGLLVALSGGGALSDPVRIRGVQYFGDLPTLIGETEGFFEANPHGIEVSYGLSGKANMAALRRGEIDYALMAMTPFVLDRMADPTPGEAGDPIILANLTHGAPNIMVIAREDAEESVTLTPKRLEGRRIGLPLGTNAEYLWSLFAAFHEIDMSKVDLIDSAPDQISGALAKGEIEAAFIWAPWLQAIRDKSSFRLAALPGDLRFLYTSRWVLVTLKDRERTQDHHHELLLNSYLEAVDWIQRHPEVAAKRFYETWGVDEADTGVAAMNDAIFDVTLDWSLYAAYYQQIKWADGASYPSAGGTGDFLSAIEIGPLRLVSPSSVLLPLASSVPPE